MAKMQTCGDCSGYGIVSDYRGGDFNGAMECDECEGSGYVRPRDAKGRFLKIDYPEYCQTCQGIGILQEKSQLGPEFYNATYVESKYCPDCGGTGYK